MQKFKMGLTLGCLLASAAMTYAEGAPANAWPPPVPAAAPAATQAYRPQQAQQQYRPTAVPKRVLAGRLGFGLDTVPGASPASVLGGVLSAPNAIALRYWATEAIALDGLLAMDMNSIQTGTGGSSSGSTSGSGTPGTVASGFGFGAGLKYNLSQPSRDMLAQLVARASFASSTQSDPTGLIKLNTGTMSLFAGLGFEVFVPHWDWLSLEGSMGLALTSQSVKPESGSGPAAAAAAAAATQSSSRISLGGAGFTPLNVSIHAYF